MPWNRAFWDGVNTTHHHQNHKDWLRLRSKVSGLKFSTFITRKQHTYPKDKILRKSLVYGDAQETFISSFYPTFYRKHTYISPTVKHHESLHLMLSMYLPLSFSLTYSDLVPQLTANAKSQKKAKEKEVADEEGNKARGIHCISSACTPHPKCTGSSQRTLLQIKISFGFLQALCIHRPFSGRVVTAPPVPEVPIISLWFPL